MFSVCFECCQLPNVFLCVRKNAICIRWKKILFCTKKIVNKVAKNAKQITQCTVIFHFHNDKLGWNLKHSNHKRSKACRFGLFSMNVYNQD